MTRRPLVHAAIFETIPPPAPMRVPHQRLYVLFGPETSRLNVRDQRLYAVFGPETSRLNVRDQRLYAVFGPETSRLNVRSQRLYMINDLSTVTDYRYWQLMSMDTSDNFYGISKLEFRSVVDVAEQATGGTPYANNDWEDFADAFDDDATNVAISKNDGSKNRNLIIGYDFGAGNEFECVQVAITSDDDSSRLPFREFELQASNDNVVWETKLRVTGEAAWSNSETRTYNV